jgi:exopolysaccharide biosynthesis polyprenyl glycosylphosphotransferase
MSLSTAEPVAERTPDLYGAIEPLLDERTLSILQRRRTGLAPQRRGWLVRRTLALGDVFGLTLAFTLAALLFAGHGDSNFVSDTAELLIFVLTIPLWLLAANLYGLYDSDEERTDHSTADDLVGVFHLVTVGSWVFFIGAALTGLADPPLFRQVTFWGIAIVLVTSARALARAVSRRTLAYQQNTIIVGAGDVGQLVAHKFSQHPEYGINLVGFVDANPRDARPGLTTRILGTPDQLQSLIPILDVERVVIAFSSDSHEETLDLIRSVKDMNVQIDIVPRLFEVLGANVGVHTAEGLPLIGLPPLKLKRSAKLMKRAMDLLVAGLGLLTLSPLFAIIALAIRLDSGGPALFRQERRGAGESVFRIFKFRTMVQEAEDMKASLASLNKHLAEGSDGLMFKIDDDPRLTGVGRVLRRYSLDELPQLINVVRGEMSLVGPRPLILDEDQYVIDWKRRRLNLKPGITGLWQVLGRDDIPFEEMVKLDYLYVTTWSLMNDVKLVLRTIPLLFRAHHA